MKKPAFGHFGGAAVQPSGSNRHSARRTKSRYDFLLRRKPFGTPLQKMTPSRTDQMAAGATSAVHCSAMSLLGISETKPSFCAAKAAAARKAQIGMHLTACCLTATIIVMRGRLETRLPSLPHK